MRLIAGYFSKNSKYQTTHVKQKVTLYSILSQCKDSEDYENLLEHCVKESAKVIEDCEGDYVAVFVEGHSSNIQFLVVNLKIIFNEYENSFYC